MNDQQKWEAKARKILVNKKIIDAFYSDKGEEMVFIIALDDGTCLMPVSDNEANQPGAIHWYAKNKTDGILPTL